MRGWREEYRRRRLRGAQDEQRGPKSEADERATKDEESGQGLGEGGRGVGRRAAAGGFAVGQVEDGCRMGVEVERVGGVEDVEAEGDVGVGGEELAVGVAVEVDDGRGVGVVVVVVGGRGGGGG